MANERDDERRETEERADDDDELIDTDVDLGGDDDELFESDTEGARETERTGSTEVTEPEIGGPGSEPGTADEPGPERGVTDEPGPETGVTDEPGVGTEPGMTDTGTEDPGMGDTGTTDTGMADTGTTDAGAGGADAPRARVTDDDIGKDVIDDRGDRIGIIAGVEGQHVHIDPDPGIADRIKAALGWGDTDDDDTYVVEQDQIQDVEGDAVRLHRM